MTHPFHPLYGREFTLLERRNTWGENRVYFYDEMGRLRRLPAAWTSAGAPDAFAIMSGGRSPFRVAELLQLVALITRQKEAKGTKKDGRRQAGVSGK